VSQRDQLLRCEREIAAAEAAFRKSGELGHYVWMRDWQRERALLCGEKG